jgi:AbrB family looped-hinge helix DNA binding protein
MARARPATIDRFGRVLIPKRLRDAVGLREGTELEIVAEGRALRLVPREEGAVFKRVGGVLVITSTPTGDLVDAVERVRAERHRRMRGGK